VRPYASKHTKSGFVAVVLLLLLLFVIGIVHEPGATARQSTRCVIVDPLGGRAWVIEQGKRARFLRYVDHGEGDAVWRGAWPRDAKLLVTRGQGRGLRPTCS
jgi:hypothetical protein